MATAAGQAREKRRRKRGSSWAAWLPLAIGILMTPVALRAASVLALSGPDGLTLLYPFVQIVQNPVLRVPVEFADPVAQWIMYLQFPIYGLLMTWLLRRSKGFLAAAGTVVFLHAAAWGAAYLLAHFQNPFLRLG